MNFCGPDTLETALIFNSASTKIRLGNSGNVIISVSNSTNRIFENIVLKYNSAGNILWNYQFFGLYQTINDMFVDNSQNIYLTGSVTIDTIPFVNNCFTVKLNSAGNLQWSKLHNLYSNEFGQSITGDNKGNVFVTGPYNATLTTNEDFLVIKYNSNGDTLWSRINNSPGDYVVLPKFIQTDSSGNVYAGAEIYSLLGSEFGTALIKYNSSGVLQFRNDSIYSNRQYLLFDMKMDVQNNVYFSGTMYDLSGPTYLFVSNITRTVISCHSHNILTALAKHTA